MDIIFVNSINFIKSTSLPIGLLSLSSILKSNGFSVKIIDFDYMYTNGDILLSNNINITLSSFCNILLKENPKIISFYTMCNSYPFIIKLSEKLKSQNSKIKILFGGPQATLTARFTLEKFKYVDAIGLGEGENTIVEIVKSIISGKDISNISGIAIHNNNTIKINNNNNIIDNLDKLPYIDYTLSDNLSTSNSINIDVGRGCPYGCTFCSTSLFWKKRYRIKSENRLIDEIQNLKSNYNIKKFLFEHDMFTADRKKIISFCKRLIDEEINIEWRCSARADCLDDELLYYMSKAGCREIFLGIESGSQKIQNLINKRLNIDLIYSRITLLKKYNIKPTLSFIYGFYSETIEDLKKTIDMIFYFMKNGIYDVQLHKLMIMPGTKEFSNLSSKLYISDDNINSNIFESRYLKELAPLIKSSKEIFCNFYEFDTDIRKRYKELDTFISFVTLIYPCFRATMDLLIKHYYNNDYLKFYLKNEKQIKNIKNKICLNQYEQIDVSNKIIPKYFFECFYKIMNQFSNSMDDNINLMIVYKFEKDIRDFIEFSNKVEKIVEYDVDIINYISNLNKGYEPNIVHGKYKVLFKKVDNKQVKILKVK